MRKRSLVLAIITAFIVVGGMASLIGHVSEPEYQGKPLSAWLGEARENGEISPDDQLDTSCARAVRAIGSSGVPTLLRMIRAKDNPFRRRWWKLVAEQTWFHLPHREPTDAEEEGIYGFVLLGPVAKSAAPDLIALINDDDPHVRGYAALSLGFIGRTNAEVVSVLEKYLDAAMLRLKNSTNPDPQIEPWAALFALGEIGPAARAAVPKITPFANTNGWAKGLAQAVLFKITGTGLDAVLEPLTDTSNITNWHSSMDAIRVLCTRASPAVPWLLTNLQQTNMQIQTGAIDALGCIHAQPEKCLPALATFLRSANGWTRAQALKAIANYGGSAGQWAPTAEIVLCQVDPDEQVRRAATNTLRRITLDAISNASAK